VLLLHLFSFFSVVFLFLFLLRSLPLLLIFLLLFFSLSFSPHSPTSPPSFSPLPSPSIIFSNPFVYTDDSSPTPSLPSPFLASCFLSSQQTNHRVLCHHMRLFPSHFSSTAVLCVREI
jgi:hypothetical protein